MGKEVNVEKVISLAGTKKGTISISKICEPYGEGSGDVASIGISLNGDIENPDWKAHIPMDNLDEVIEALKELN